MADQATKAPATPLAEKLAALDDSTLAGLWGSVERELARRRAVAQREALAEDQRAAERRRQELRERKAAKNTPPPERVPPLQDIEIGAEIYRSSDDPLAVWRGMGRRPKWMTKELANKGVTAESLKSVWTADDARAAQERMESADS